MTIFLCEDSFEGILCGVYDAWMSRLGHKNVKLALLDRYEPELFAQYREAEKEETKIKKVSQAVREKISEEAYTWIYKASLSQEEGKADSIYRFLIYGFHIGREVTDCLQIPAVHDIFRLNRAVTGEAHLLTEFLRFSQWEDRILFSAIGPKNDVVTLLMPHFCDRLRSERFIIYDEKRQKAAVHREGTYWYLLTGREAGRLGELAGRTDAGEYASLWRAFFDSIAVKERTNYVCQRSHLPLRFRYYMTEFQRGS